jgi:hypothetical protein
MSHTPVFAQDVNRILCRLDRYEMTTGNKNAVTLPVHLSGSVSRIIALFDPRREVIELRYRQGENSCYFARAALESTLTRP